MRHVHCLGISRRRNYYF